MSDSERIDHDDAGCQLIVCQQCSDYRQAWRHGKAMQALKGNDVPPTIPLGVPAHVRRLLSYCRGITDGYGDTA